MIVDQNGTVRRLSSSRPSALAQSAQLLQDLLTVRVASLATSLSEIDFGGEMVLGDTRNVALNVINEGRNNLEVTAIRSDNRAITVNDTSFLVAPGGSKEIILSITPVSGGTLSGTLTFVSNDPEKEAFQLSINPVEVLVPPGELSTLASRVDFGSVEVNRNASESITLENIGAGPLVVTQIASNVTGLLLPNSQILIPPGESWELVLTLNTGLAGSSTGSITIATDAPGSEAIQIPISWAATVIHADTRADFNDDRQVTFGDFILFVQAYNTTDTLFDLNDNSVVDFGDFVIFVKSFGRPLP